MDDAVCPFTKRMYQNKKDEENGVEEEKEEERGEEELTGFSSNEENNGSEQDSDLKELEELRNSLLAQLQEEDEVEKDEDQADEGRSSSEEDVGEDEEEEGHESSGSESDQEQEEPLEESSVLSIGQVERNEDIDNMLETPVEQTENDRPNHISKRLKRVLEYRGMDHFDVLPDGWVEITHSSGLPVYLHKPSRCCTFSRPYFIGRGSVRNHRIPESAIPCLFQRKLRTEMEKNENGLNETAEDNNENSSSILSRLSAPNIKVKTEADWQKSQLTPDQLYEYAKQCFKFKNICIFRFRKWSEARNFYKRKKARRAFNQSMAPSTSGEVRPSLHSSVKLITVPTFEADSKPHQRAFFLNPQGKTSISILHEFVQKVLKCSVRYFFSETRSSATPFHCVVKLVHSSCGTPASVGSSSNNNEQLSKEMIRRKIALLQSQIRRSDPQKSDEKNETIDLIKNENEQETEERGGKGEELIRLGEGVGAGKKIAKLTAAKDALQKLVQDIEFDEEGIAIATGNRMNENNDVKKSENPTEEEKALDPLHIFDLLGITDTRIQELSARAGQPSPYLILQEYLKRCSAYGDTALELTTRRLRHQKHEFTLTLGDNLKVRAVSTNKREGKQKAAQAMLKKLHPNNTTWGSLLRLYGYEAQQKLKEARKSKDGVTKLQGISDEQRRGKRSKCDGGEFQPNNVILDKLRSEMLKLSEGLIDRRMMESGQKKLDEQQQMAERFLEEEEGEEPKAKLRRTNFQWELPILSEEQLRHFSSRIAAKNPDDELAHIPSLKF